MKRLINNYSELEFEIRTKSQATWYHVVNTHSTFQEDILEGNTWIDTWISMMLEGDTRRWYLKIPKRDPGNGRHYMKGKYPNRK